MHYFSLNIKDFAWATRGYCPIGRLAYLELCMRYVDTEAPLSGTPEELARKISLPENAETVAMVLKDHFKATRRGWVSAYCDSILENITAKRKRAANASEKAAKAAAGRRFGKSKIGTEIGTEIGTHPLTQKPMTHDPTPNNPKTTEKNAATRRGSISKPEEIDQQIWDDWLKARGRAPLTATAWSVIQTEARKADLTPAQAVEIAAGNGWRGFKAEWLQKRGRTADELDRMNYQAPAAGFAAAQVWDV